jgi:hypothetical protein
MGEQVCRIVAVELKQSLFKIIRSRLSDVVKGTAKAKISTSSSRDKDLPAQPEVSATPPLPPPAATPTAASIVSSAPKTAAVATAAQVAAQPKVVKTSVAKVEEAPTVTPPPPPAPATPPNFPEK